MNNFYVLSIDQSTQGTKAVILNDSGIIQARHDLPHKQIINENGWVSHDPEEIYENVIKTVKMVVEKAGIDKNRILCVGISNQRETTVVWDKKTGKPLCNAIVWQCNRAKDICERIKKAGYENCIAAKSGLKLSPYYPAGKMTWFMENVPDVDKKADDGDAAFGTIDSWLVYKLTKGKSYKTDYSNASRTQLLNLTTLKWDEQLCDIFGIPVKALPEISDSNSVFGETDFEGYLEKPIPICGVLGDSHGALFGHNCRKEGSIKVTYGTGSSVMLNTGNIPIFSKHGLSTSLAWVIDGKASYVLEGNINHTGAVISWLKDALGLIQSAKETAELSKRANPNDGTYLVPAFTGLGAPYWKSEAKAIIAGMSRSTGKAELVKAANESIAYQINDVILAMRKDTGLEISELCVDGGPTRDDYLMQFQSDISDADIKIPNIEELSATGAAFLAGMSANLYDDTVYNAISYRFYHSKMNSQVRNEKVDGWKAAVNMLLSKE